MENNLKNQQYPIQMRITKILIDSGLTVSTQLKVIKTVAEKLEFCKKIGQELNQKKLNL
jgi:predicted regulator of amino acid metabolism with ACT domain